MTTELTQLEELERLLIERRQHFIAMNENAAEHCTDPDFFITNERLLAHYDQLIDIVRQAIAIGAKISPENKEHFLSFLIEPVEKPMEKRK